MQWPGAWVEPAQDSLSEPSSCSRPGPDGEAHTFCQKSGKQQCWLSSIPSSDGLLLQPSDHRPYHPTTPTTTASLIPAVHRDVSESGFELPLQWWSSRGWTCCDGCVCTMSVAPGPPQLAGMAGSLSQLPHHSEGRVALQPPQLRLVGMSLLAKLEVWHCLVFPVLCSFQLSITLY